MKTRFFVTFVLAAILALALAGTVFAQGPEPACPPDAPCEPEGQHVPWQKLPPDQEVAPQVTPPLEGGPGQEAPGPWRMSPEGYWFMPQGARPVPTPPGLHIQSTGGPDDFGYTWNDSESLNWIDATGGTNTGLSSSTTVAGPFLIGFSFKYYENTYTQFWVSRYGLLGFNSGL